MIKIENIETKQEITHFEQSFLLPQYFQQLPAADTSHCICKWEMDNKGIPHMTFKGLCINMENTTNTSKTNE